MAAKVNNEKTQKILKKHWLHLELMVEILRAYNSVRDFFGQEKWDCLFDEVFEYFERKVAHQSIMIAECEIIVAWHYNAIYCILKFRVNTNDW